MDVVAINLSKGVVQLSDDTFVPILGYYDYSSSEEQVEPKDAEQLVAGTEQSGFWSIRVSDFDTVTIQ